jgi:hypothetical protein
MVPSAARSAPSDALCRHGAGPVRVGESLPGMLRSAGSRSWATTAEPAEAGHRMASTERRIMTREIIAVLAIAEAPR